MNRVTPTGIEAGTAGEWAWLRDHIRDVPDFPRPGVVFKDLTPLFADAHAFAAAVRAIAASHGGGGITKVVGIEARGFVFAAPVAVCLEAGFVPVRKKGKLPLLSEAATYDLEYGTDTLEIHADGITADDRVLIVDDVIATGGTAAATVQLVRRLGATVVGLSVVVELEALEGRRRLDGLPVAALVRYA